MSRAFVTMQFKANEISNPSRSARNQLSGPPDRISSRLYDGAGDYSNAFEILQVRKSLVISRVEGRENPSTGPTRERERILSLLFQEFALFDNGHF